MSGVTREPAGNLDGVRVVELADEQAEYAGQLLAGLGADVFKVEPPGGSPTRGIGPFYQDVEDPERSLFFWHYNRGKRSVVADLATPTGRGRLLELIARADVVLDSTPNGYLASVGIDVESIRKQHPALIVARMSPFGDSGPWTAYKGSDLIHLALGGPVMNCGYDSEPGGTYDLPPVAPQMPRVSEAVDQALQKLANGNLKEMGNIIAGFFLVALMVWTAVKTMAAGRGFGELIGEWVPIWVSFAFVYTFLDQSAAKGIEAFMTSVGSPFRSVLFTCMLMNCS